MNHSVTMLQSHESRDYLDGLARRATPIAAYKRFWNIPLFLVLAKPMELILKIVRGQADSTPAQSEVVVMPGKALSIGRGEGSDWLLPDPTDVISRIHCHVEDQGDGFYVTDVSRHGVSIDGQPIKKKSPTRLPDGAVLSIGDYEIQVTVGHDQASSPNVVGEIFPRADGASDDEDPFKAFDNRNKLDSISERPGEGSSSAKRTAPEVRKMSSQEPEPDGPKLDADWYKKKPPRNESASNQAKEIDIDVSARHRPPVKEDSAVVAFLRGAGLQETTLSPELEVRAMGVVGAIFRETVVGLISLLQAKRDFKEFVGAASTRWGSLVNPLKAGSNVEKIMKAMLTEHEMLMPSVDAIRDGMTQVKCHELALLAGMKSAIRQLVKTFEPDTLEERVSEESGISQWLPFGHKGRCWEAFKKLHGEIAADLDEGQRNILMEEFARAYDEQVNRCS